MTRVTATALIASICFAVGCDKKPEGTTATPDKSATAATGASPAVLASASGNPASLAPASPSAKSFAFDPGGKISIDMPAPKEHIKATAQNVGGDLSVDPANLTLTRGVVKVDLTTLKTATFEDPKKNATQTEHALTWLEVGAKATAEDQAKNKFIVFTIKGVEGLSATELAKVAATKDGADDVRTVTAKVKGEVLLHGKTSQRDAEVSVSFRGPADKPTRVDVKTTKPLKIVLADHDVKPRDDVGKIAQRAFDLLGTKVANEADVSLDLSAKPK